MGEEKGDLFNNNIVIKVIFFSPIHIVPVTIASSTFPFPICSFSVHYKQVRIWQLGLVHVVVQRCSVAQPDDSLAKAESWGAMRVCAQA